MTKIYVEAYGPHLYPQSTELTSINEGITDWVEYLKLEGYDTFKLRRIHA